MRSIFDDRPFGRRPRRDRSDPATGPSVEPSVEEVLAGGPPEAPPGLAELPALIARLEAAGHPVRYSPSPTLAQLRPELGRTAYELVASTVDVVCRRLPAGQNLTLRIRVDGASLVLSMQSSGLDGLGQRGLVPESERAVVRERVQALGGTVALRRTASGNWLGIVTLPL